MAKEMFCKRCGTVAKPKREFKGSIFIEIVLWVCFVIPGLIYSLWRMSSSVQVCPKCKSSELIPTDSPVMLKD